MTRLLCWYLRKATAETRAQILTQNTSNDADPRKEVPFGGRETKIYGFDPHFPQNRHFLGPISDLDFFSPENGFNIGRLESKSKKVKFSHTRYRALGPELIPVYRQSARR